MALLYAQVMVFEQNVKEQTEENMIDTARINAGAMLHFWRERLDARPAPASTRRH